MTPEELGERRDATQPSGTELAGLGVVAAAAVIVPLLGGLGLDSVLHTTPLGLVVGLLLGIVAAVTSIYVRFRRYW
jgi:F0F1-type ATP synthase assembly protein I